TAESLVSYFKLDFDGKLNNFRLQQIPVAFF
ncbi:unnamed protein product, partial [marine sediment metagenome]